MTPTRTLTRAALGALALLLSTPLLSTKLLSTKLLGAPPAAAHGYTLGALRIDHPWSRATPNGAKVGGGYLSVTNTGSEPDRLTGATVEGAGRVEMHSMSMEGGVMRMAPIEGGLVIKPGETVTLKPGGLHLMFLDLGRPLKQGERIKGSLTFERAGAVPVEFAVEAIGARAPHEGAPHGEGMHEGADHGAAPGHTH